MVVSEISACLNPCSCRHLNAERLVAKRLLEQTKRHCFNTGSPSAFVIPQGQPSTSTAYKLLREMNLTSSSRSRPEQCLGHSNDTSPPSARASSAIVMKLRSICTVTFRRAASSTSYSGPYRWIHIHCHTDQTVHGKLP